MGTGNQHQWAVEGRVVGEGDGKTHCPHPWHAVFGVPGFKIGVPVKALAVEAGFEVDPGLVDIGVATQKLAYHCQNFRIPGQTVEAIGQFVNAEYRADFLFAGLSDGAL